MNNSLPPKTWPNCSQGHDLRKHGYIVGGQWVCKLCKHQEVKKRGALRRK